MRSEPDFSVNKFINFQKKKKKKAPKKKFVNDFVEKMTTINEVFKKQMGFVQISYENFAKIYKQNVPVMG